MSKLKRLTLFVEGFASAALVNAIKNDSAADIVIQIVILLCMLMVGCFVK